MITKKEVNLKVIVSVLSILLVGEGFFMILGLPFAFYFKDGSWSSLLISGLITSLSGGILWLLTRSKERNTVNRREGYVIVSLTWVVVSLFGTLPFLISGTISSFTDAFFETMSGFTTTGATILTDIESMPHGILFWRSLTHWIGGMGIIVLTVAILPFLGVGGMQLYAAEMPGVKKDKLHPRITETAKRLWGIYLILTVAETALLMAGGMDLFDGLCHTFGTVATGGFSTKNDSIAGFSPYIQYVIIIFMVLAGTNFTLHYFALHGRFREIIKHEEFRKYIYLIVFITLVLFGWMVFAHYQTPGKSIRDALFQVVSIITTTGYITSDYLDWPGEIWLFILVLMFIGGMAGSTGGGIKVIRQILLVKNAVLELRRTLHPQAIIPVRLSGQAVSQDIIFKVMAFFQIYIMTFLFGTLIMSLLGLDFSSAVGASIATLGNIGPGLGLVGPTGNYAEIHSVGKWFLSVMMLMGRLELFTVMILFSSAFWKR